MKLAANLTFLFKEYPFLDRFAVAREHGFDGVEVLFPYDEPAGEIADRLKALDLQLVLMNAPPPNWAGGERGFAALPGGEERFRQDFRRALRFAARLKARHLHIMSGRAQGLVARATLVANLRWAAAEAPGQSLVIEPVNGLDMPGYFLSHADLALSVLEEVAAPNLGLLFDSFHIQAMTGDAAAAFARLAPWVRHVHLADHPDRGEPGRDDLDLPALMAAIRSSGYAGWIGGEYVPRGRTEDGLGWMALP